MENGTHPNPGTDLVLPDSWLAMPFRPRLMQDSPEQALAPLFDEPALEPAPDASLETQAWEPWGWACLHHPKGVETLAGIMSRAIQAGNVPWFQALAQQWPVSEEGVEAWHRLERLVWARPVHPGPKNWDQRGDWRHTLALWRSWKGHPAGMDSGPLNLGAEKANRDYLGTNPHRWGWRLDHFQAWQAVGLPPPPLSLALQLAGCFWYQPNGWERWLVEGFEPANASCHQQVERRAQALWDHLIGWASANEEVRNGVLRAWLESARGSGTGERDSSWRELEKAWAQRLAKPELTQAPPGGWAHAVAGSPGFPRLGLETLQRLPWEAWQKKPFSALLEGLLPWEHCQRTLDAFEERWSAQERMEARSIVAWMRSQSRQEALSAAWNEALPYARGPRL